MPSPRKLAVRGNARRSTRLHAGDWTSSSCGRQTPTDGGPSDLLGVDTAGRLLLVYMSMKRDSGHVRDAVTQCIDYASALDAMGPAMKTLAKHIAEHSGTATGLRRSNDFKAWYERDASRERT